MVFTPTILILLGGMAGVVGGLLLAIPSRRLVISALLAVVGGGLGVIFLPYHLEPLVGSYIRNALHEPDPSEVLFAELEDNPFFGAMIEAHPQSGEGVRLRLKDAYRAGGERVMRQEGVRIGAEFVNEVTTRIGLRARDEDLIRAMGTFEAVADSLAQSAPMICYQWIIGQQMGQGLDAAAFHRAIGSEQERILVESFASLIRNAQDSIPTYDRKAAQAGVAVAGHAAVGALGQANVDLISGLRVPKTNDDARLACIAERDVYRMALAQPNAADVLREMLQRH